MNSLPEGIKPRIEAWRAFAAKHIDPESDLTLFILKAHLVLEQLMTSIIELRCTTPTGLKGAGITFHKKIALLRAFASAPIPDEIFSVLHLINQMRNDLAHTLDRPNESKNYGEALKLANKMMPDCSSAQIVTGKDALFYLVGACQEALSVVEVLSRAFESYAEKKIEA